MAIEQTFRHVIVLPPALDVHQTVVAFLATSEHGIWKIDSQAQSTPYVLHFLRGNWKKAWFGLSSRLSPEFCDVDVRGHNVPDTRPMKLRITLRPSPSDVRLSMLFSVFNVFSYEYEKNQGFVEYWTDRVAKEVKDLSEYLRKSYGLPEPLRCEEE